MMPGQFNPQMMQQMMAQQQMMQQQQQQQQHHHQPQHHPGGHNPMMHAQHHPQQMPGQPQHHPQQHHQMQHHPQGTPQQQRMRTASQSSQPHFHGTPVPGQGGAGAGGAGGGGAGSASSATPAKRRGPPGHTVAAAAAQGGGASAAAMAALQPVAPDEEDTSHGDFLDFVTPREIANHRFQLMYEYMEEVFSSPYKASQIVDPEDATGGLLLAARLSLTEGLFDAKGAPVGDLTRDQACAKVSERAKKMVDDTNKEMSTLEQRHKRTLEKFHKRGEVLKQVYREQRKESYEVWNDFAREMGMMPAEPSFRGTAAYTFDATTEKPRGPEELTKVVEGLYDINIETDREALKVVQQGQGFITEEMRREAEAARQEFLLANASPINETAEEVLQDAPMEGENNNDAAAAAAAGTTAGTTGDAATGAAEGGDAAAVSAAAAQPSSTTGKDPVAVIPVVIGNTYNNASSAPAEPSQAPSTTATAPSIPTASPAATAAIATTPAAQPPQPTPPGAAGTPGAAAAAAPAEPPQDNDISMMDVQPDDVKDNSGDNGNNDMTMEEDTVGMMLDDLDMTAAAGDMSSSSANLTPIPPVTTTTTITANIPSPQPPVAPTTADSGAGLTPGNITSPHSATGTPLPTGTAAAAAGTPGGLTPGAVAAAKSPAVKSPSPLPNTATPEMEQKFKEPTPSAIEPSKEISSTDEPPTVPGEENVPSEFIANDGDGATKDKSPSLGLKSPAAVGTPGLQEGAAGGGTPAAAGMGLDVPAGGEQKAASPKPEGSGGDAPAA